MPAEEVGERPAAVLRRAARLAADYLESLDRRPVFPTADVTDLRRALAGSLPAGPTDPLRVVEELAAGADPGLVAVGAGRYFGFVTGGEVPAALAAEVLATVWDQNAFSFVSSPAAAVIEEVAAGWVKEILDLPAGASVGFVTGCQLAHVACLAAARHDVLRRHGWDVETQGLAGGPPVRVVTGVARHVTVDRALRFLGLGTGALELVSVDGQGRVDVGELEEALTALSGPVIVIAQAGEVNTGSFDDIARVVAAARAAGAWVHVDGAFGIWARAVPNRRRLAAGIEGADSWAFDAHKWLNVPYDSGIAVCARPEAHRAAMLGEAAYLVPTAGERDAFDWTPEASRRARGIAVYAALRSLGRSGVADLVERCCVLAHRFAAGVVTVPGAEVLNEVVLNQVLFRFGDDAATAAVLGSVQRSGVAWMGGTRWQDRVAIRLSVSNWATTTADIDRTLEAVAGAARSAGSAG